MSLMKKYEKNIVFNLASHIHRGKILAPVSTQVPDLNLVMVVTPAFSPVYNNNPGFSIIDVVKVEDSKSSST